MGRLYSSVDRIAPIHLQDKRPCLLYDARPLTEQPMAKDIDNPCVSLCQLNSELCVSCGRTREEIRKWRGMKRPEKMATVQRAATRMKAIVKKNAKRQANE